jgi:hypothetical protein
MFKTSVALMITSLLLSLTVAAEAGPGFRRVQRLLDLSGLAWMGGDIFLAVHDAKFPDERSRVRVSLLKLPSSLKGILWKPLRPRFPGGKSNDLESASRIPGTQMVLLVESADDASDFERIFLAERIRNRVKVLGALDWGSFTNVFNVEGTAVAETDDGYVFLWAERAHGDPNTVIKWTDLTLQPFAIGSSGVISSVPFPLPDDVYTRALVAMDVDDTGQIYIATAFDPDSDNGPYRSAVFKIGQVLDGEVVLDPEPALQATMDGLKVEAVAVRSHEGETELFIGTDDENYGGTLRLLPKVDSD